MDKFTHSIKHTHPTSEENQTALKALNDYWRVVFWCAQQEP
jgi:hypothetical protein